MIPGNRRIIKLFESVPKFDTYSQYSNSLEKVFHENSFKHLIKNLKEERKPKIYSYFNVDEQKNDSDRFNLFKYRKNIKKNNSKYNLLYDEEVTKKNNPKEPKNQVENILKSLRNINKRNRFDSNFYPFHYNPNYNSIMKKIPCVKIIKPTEVNNKRPTTFLTEIGELTVSSNNKNNKSVKIKNRKNKLSLSVKKDKENHSIRFDKCLGRKEIKTETNENISYIEPYDYKKARNNSTDFNKMLSRFEETPLEKERKEGPSVGCYDPHYEYFETRVQNISLGNEHTNKKNKKFLLKKLWGSYNVRMEYLLVDNRKLNNDILKNKDKIENDYKQNLTEPNQPL